MAKPTFTNKQQSFVQQFTIQKFYQRSETNATYLNTARRNVKNNCPVTTILCHDKNSNNNVHCKTVDLENLPATTCITTAV